MLKVPFSSKVYVLVVYHRTVGVERDLCGSSGPTPLPKQGHLEQVTQETYS